MTASQGGFPLPAVTLHLSVIYIEQNSVYQMVFNISSDCLVLFVRTSLSAFIRTPEMADEM